MAKIIIASVQVCKMDCEGVPVSERIAKLHESIKRVEKKRNKVLKHLEKPGAMDVLNLYSDVLKDYYDELNFYLGEV